MKKSFARSLVAISAALYTSVSPAIANGPIVATVPKPLLAQTPPMGWNSWNRFACQIDEAKVRSAADALVSSGMKEAGYQYVVIDDCWQSGRNHDGSIQIDASKFPSGMKLLADYVHSRGLKFGIYSDAGQQTCGGRPGSAGHEYQDAKTYAKWGVDYLKYDWCFTKPASAVASYTIMADALRTSGRDIVFSICEWGSNAPRDWAPALGHLWRTTGDIMDSWGTDDGHSHSMLEILDAQVDLAGDAGPGRWNDPDMLEIGNGGMTDSEYRAHFSLWAILAAPLIAGNDLSTMSAETRAILTNKDVIAVDQDALGAQGRRVAKNGDAEVWARPLTGGRRAVVLLNRSGKSQMITTDWADLQLPDALKASVKDLWTKQIKGGVKGRFTSSVPAHGAVMVTISPTI